MSSDAKDIKTNQAETVGNESVGDKLGYDKDSSINPRTRRRLLRDLESPMTKSRSFLR